MSESPIIDPGADWVNESLKLAYEAENHPIMLKSEFFLQSLAYMMDRHEEEVLLKAVQISFLLMQNPANYDILTTDFFFTNGLDLAYTEMKKSKSSVSFRHILIRELVKKVRDVDYDMKYVRTLFLRGNFEDILIPETVRFHVEELSEENRGQVHEVLATVRGVLSVVSDVPDKLVTLSVTQYFTDRLARSALKAQLMFTMGDLLIADTTLDDTDPTTPIKVPPYPPVDSPVKPGALVTATTARIKNTATSFVAWFQESFYW